MKNKTLIGTVVAGASIMVGGLLTGGLTVDAAPQYPLPPTTTISGVNPIPPPVTLPPTGSNGVNDTVFIGATIAAAGGALLLVSRRRRERAATTE